MGSFSVLLLLFLSAICNAEPRTWTAIDGKKVEAEFASNEKGIVKLRLKSGKVFEFPANKLSKEDNEFISSLAKPEGVNWNEELEFREDTAYLKGSDTLYAGKAVLWHENGQKEIKKTLRTFSDLTISVSQRRRGYNIEACFKY